MQNGHQLFLPRCCPPKLGYRGWLLFGCVSRYVRSLPLAALHSIWLAHFASPRSPEIATRSRLSLPPLAMILPNSNTCVSPLLVSPDSPSACKCTAAEQRSPVAPHPFPPAHLARHQFRVWSVLARWQYV